MKYISNKEIFIYIVLGLGIGFVGYIMMFILSPIIDYSEGGYHDEHAWPKEYWRHSWRYL